jgi:hypothetical protein
MGWPTTQGRISTNEWFSNRFGGPALKSARSAAPTHAAIDRWTHRPSSTIDREKLTPVRARVDYWRAAHSADDARPIGSCGKFWSGRSPSHRRPRLSVRGRAAFGASGGEAGVARFVLPVRGFEPDSVAANDAIIPHRLLLQISALLESLPQDATKGVRDEFGHKLPIGDVDESPAPFLFLGQTEEAGEVHRHTMTTVPALAMRCQHRHACSASRPLNRVRDPLRHFVFTPCDDVDGNPDTSREDATAFHPPDCRP